MKFISTAFHNKLSKSALRPGDVAIVRTGKPGTTCVIPDELLDANCSDIVIARVKNDLLCPYYLSYFMNAMAHGQINAHIVGAVQQHFNVGSAKKIEIPLPPRSIQTQIVDILKVIDDKRQINQKTNQTLEQMAQALFKSWFVDFDPVFDNLLASVDFKLENLENRLPDELIQKAQRRLAALNSLENATECKASLIALAHELQAQTQAAVQVSEKAAKTPVKANFSILTQHANTHAHFPNEFEHNEQLGWIPKGWNVRKISSFSEILNGFAFKSGDYIESGNFVLRTKNFKGNEVKKATDDVYLPDEFMTSHNKYLCQPFDYHLVMVGASVGKCAIIYPHNLPALRNQNMWCFRTKKDSGVEQSFIKYMLDRLVSKSLGLASGSAREFFRKGDFGNQEICTGTNDIQSLFHVLCGEYLDKMSKNSAQVEILTKLRDTLLPKLISGELQIPDVATDEEVVD